jgi:ferredoxin-NADP reductase
MTATRGVVTTVNARETMQLMVEQVTWQADAVVSLRLRPAPGVSGDLPAWSAGAHLDIVVPSGLVRQYSLCGDPDDRGSYTVAVLRETAGRGGSAEIHDSAMVGRILEVRGPRNHFKLATASSYLFIAGGIGITPILAMVREAVRSDVPWRLYYGGRTRRSMAFVTELRVLGAEHVVLCPQDEVGILDLDQILRDTPPEAQVYCCGPEGLLRAVETASAAATPPRAVQIERFAAASHSGLGKPPTERTGFEVELRRSGFTLPVPPDRTLLDVVREVVPDVGFSCEDGYCGTCETRVLGGVPEHHDDVLRAEERELGETMMICVGRSATPVLVLDL